MSRVRWASSVSPSRDLKWAVIPHQSEHPSALVATAGQPRSCGSASRPSLRIPIAVHHRLRLRARSCRVWAEPSSLDVRVPTPEESLGRRPGREPVGRARLFRDGLVAAEIEESLQGRQSSLSRPRRPGHRATHQAVAPNTNRAYTTIAVRSRMSQARFTASLRRGRSGKSCAPSHRASGRSR